MPSPSKTGAQPCSCACGTGFLTWVRAALAAIFIAFPLSPSTFTFHIAGDTPGPWPNILSSVGLTNNSYGPTNLFILRDGATGTVQQWIDKIEKGAVVVVEGESDLAAALGIHPSGKHVVVRSIIDVRSPTLPIVWEKSADIPVFDLPKDARVFATERWEGAPVLASVKRGGCALLRLVRSPAVPG